MWKKRNKDFGSDSIELVDCLKITDLPDDVLYEIIDLLELKTKLLLSLSCKRFYNLIGECSLLIQNMIPRWNVYLLAQKSHHYKALQNSNRKYKSCIFTGTMTYKTIKFVGISMRESMKSVEFNNLSLNIDSFIGLLETFPNLEEISLQNIQIEGRVSKVRPEMKKLRKVTLNAVENKKTIFELLGNWTHIKELKLEKSYVAYNYLIVKQTNLEHLEVEEIQEPFMDENWIQFVNFQLKSFTSKFVLETENLINFLRTQHNLEALNVMLTVELEKQEFKDFMAVVYQQTKLKKMFMLFRETSNFEDLGFFDQLRLDLKELKLGAYCSTELVDKSSFFAAFLSTLPVLETLNLQRTSLSLTRTVAMTINRLSSLKKLILGECYDDFLEHLILPNVTSFEVFLYKGESSSWFIFFTNNQQLRELKIMAATEKNYLDEETFQQLTLLRNLEYLDVTVPNFNYVKNFIGGFPNLKMALIQIANRNLNLDSQLLDILAKNQFSLSMQFWFLKLERNFKR